LIADDEAEIRDLLRLYLENSGYDVLEAADGLEAMEILEKEHVDLAVLDVMMPRMNGIRVLKKLRETSNIPVMVLSAKDTDADKILGLDLGADDYLTKPFNPLEAVARINSNIRRFYSLGAGGANGNSNAGILKLKVKDLELDTESCDLYQGETKIELSSVEYRIMHLFMEHPGRVFTKGQIFQAGWQEEYMEDDNNVMVCISKLRGKLSDDGRKYIRTVRGLGYRMEK
ncbi:MAG: response regulator transcription factor, partial [Lachnospiraceae bacterium]|nr:response regulator transcription factor [Lachnospiraceae bacterium]